MLLTQPAFHGKLAAVTTPRLWLYFTLCWILSALPPEPSWPKLWASSFIHSHLVLLLSPCLLNSSCSKNRFPPLPPSQSLDFYFLKKLFIYLAVLGLSYDVWGLLSICGAWAYLPYGMWDLSSLTRDGTCVPCIGRQILNHWATREAPIFLLI